MDRSELLDLIPVGHGSPRSTKYNFVLGPLSGLRLSVIATPDDTDFDALWEEIKPELADYIEQDNAWLDRERRIKAILDEPYGSSD